MRALVWGNDDMSATDFDALCDGPLAGVLSGLEDSRKKAVRTFWIAMAVAVIVAGLALIFAPNMTLKLVIAVFALLGGWFLGSMPMGKVGRSLKDPAYAAICGARNMTFTGDKFSADGYQGLHRAFGSPNQQSFADRFAGEEDGRPFAFYEASLVKGSGKSRQQVFTGIIHASRRAAPLQGDTLVVPDKGLFNFLKPGGGLDRVKFEDDAEFEKRFEVYSTQPDEARALLGPEVRAKLLEWRDRHQGVHLHVGGETMTVAFNDKRSRFEAGSMMKAVPGRDRVRAMWDDLEAGIAQMREVRSVLG